MGIGLSIFLLAVGAVLAFAVTIDPTAIGSITVDWVTVGYILMIVGSIGLIWSLVMMSIARRDTRTIEERDRDRMRGM